MLTLLSPVALWSLAALALPLALHLWRQPPRTVRLPSLRFLQTQVGRRWHDLRWRERLLLLTRLGLLGALAFLLAGPRWTVPPSHVPARWILLDPNAAPAGPSLARLHALQAEGYSTHLLGPGFPIAQRSIPLSSNPSPDLWSLLREADASLPQGSTLAIFSPARLTSMRGIRPALQSTVEWVKTPDVTGDTSQSWIASLRPGASLTSTPAILIGTSEAASVHFADSPPAGWKLDTRPDRVRLLSPTNETTPWTTLKTPASFSVLILHDDARNEDADYLAAAIHAAANVITAPLDLRSEDTNADLANLPVTDWTFWLSGHTLPASISNRRTRLFQDAPHPDTFSIDWIVPQSDTLGAANLLAPVRLWRRGLPTPGSTLWTDAHGLPLLTFTNGASGPRWHFASRFHPAWTDLPRTTAFPAWLQSLLFGDVRPDARHDLRLADPDQARPSLSSHPSPAVNLPPPTLPGRDLHWLVWVVAVLLFCLERFLSQTRTSTSVTRTPSTSPEPVPAR